MDDTESSTGDSEADSSTGDDTALEGVPEEKEGDCGCTGARRTLLGSGILGLLAFAAMISRRRAISPR